jgi:formate transporter
LTLLAGPGVLSTAIVSIGTGERDADGRVPPGTGGRQGDGAATVPLFDALLPPDIARRAETVGVAKATMRFDRLVVLSVLAGAFISLGAMFATVVTAGGGIAPGVARVLGGLVFSLGLILVVVAGAELFTGNTLVVIATASRRVRVGALLKGWLIVYVGNFVGALLTTLVIFWSGFYDGGNGAVGARALEIATTKTSLGLREAVLLGVLANALVCLAIWLAMSARSVTDKILAIVFPITAFVAAGFEHSIANMYFIPAGLFIKAWSPDSFWTAAGISSGDYPTVTWQDFFVGNLLPVTIGNIVGGAVLVGLVYWFVYLRGREGSRSRD